MGRPTSSLSLLRGGANLPAVAGQFAGWKGDFKGFFLGLRANNNKPYFVAHRRQYEEEVRALLRHERLIYFKRWPVEPWIATSKARDRVAKAWRDGAALEAWCAKHMD